MTAGILCCPGIRRANLAVELLCLRRAYTMEHHHIVSPLPVFLRDSTAHPMRVCFLRVVVTTAFGLCTSFDSCIH